MAFPSIITENDVSESPQSLRADRNLSTEGFAFGINQLCDPGKKSTNLQCGELSEHILDFYV